jgi:hypothetical protein
MRRFNLLYVVEHEFDNENKTDNRIIILYDESESENGFYCYGTRKYKNDTTLCREPFEDYHMIYSIEHINTLVEFIALLNNNFNSKITVEMHQIKLSPDEYELVDFDYLNETKTALTELFAYDCIDETPYQFTKKVLMLTTAVNYKGKLQR